MHKPRSFRCTTVSAARAGILLIDCDIKTVDPKKVRGLAELKKHFREQLKGYEKLPIVPILFSPRDFRKISPSIDVMIAHRSVIEKVFEAVVQGNREKARSLLQIGRASW